MSPQIRTCRIPPSLMSRLARHLGIPLSVETAKIASSALSPEAQRQKTGVDYIQAHDATLK
jgi:hypothetical protein